MKYSTTEFFDKYSEDKGKSPLLNTFGRYPVSKRLPFFKESITDDLIGKHLNRKHILKPVRTIVQGENAETDFYIPPDFVRSLLGKISFGHRIPGMDVASVNTFAGDNPNMAPYQYYEFLCV